MTPTIERRKAKRGAYLMPAEWARQERVWFSWPHARADWPGKFAPIPWVFAEMLRVITTTGQQRVGLLVKDAKTRAEAMDMLDRSGATLSMIDFREVKTNRGWMRDAGPIWVRDEEGKLVALNWKFNGWAKYTNHKLDDAIPPAVAKYTKHKVITPMHKGKPVVLEGGGIEVDGTGNVLVTEEWLLSDVQVRNSGLTREDYEVIFSTYLGAKRTIWLEAGIVGDDTHGHIDDITRFVAPGSVVTVMEENRDDPNYAILRTNRALLGKTSLAVTELPMPRPVVFEGQRLPASYANFLICNKVVLVPVFNDPADARALTTLQACFPKHEVVGIYARDLVWGLGTIHCLSQQQPAA